MEVSVDKIKALQSGSLTPSENVEQFLKKIKKQNKDLNAFLEVNEQAVHQAKDLEGSKKKGKLYGLTFGVKSNINVQGLHASCASKTLKNYMATYDADVIRKIKAEGGIILGMTNCDEFAAGASGETSAFGPANNPIVPGHIPGGSSSGSAVAVAAGLCDFALGSDTGGSIRNPASHCGIVGIKPSYGRVSRYGLIDLSMSIDQIGPFSPDVFGAALALGVIAGHSPFDATTFAEKVDEYEKHLGLSNVKIGVSSDFAKLCTNKEIVSLTTNTADAFVKQHKLQKVDVTLKHIDLAVQAYFPMVYTEFFSATRKFDGRKYGSVIEETCGEEVLRRITGGRIISQAEFKGAYYRKSLQVKEVIKEAFLQAFKKVDVILAPTVPRLPHKLKEKISVEDMYFYDALTIPANFAEICAGVVKAGTIKNIPIGIQVMAPRFQEKKMFQVMKALEDESKDRS